MSIHSQAVRVGGDTGPGWAPPTQTEFDGAVAADAVDDIDPVHTPGPAGESVGGELWCRGDDEEIQVRLSICRATIINEDDQGLVSRTVLAGLEAADPLRRGGAGEDCPLAARLT